MRVETTLKAISSTWPAPQILIWQSRLAGFLAGLNRLWMNYLRWRFEQAAIKQLGSLSDRQLKDIGLDRSEILRAVKGRRLSMFSRYF